ncbi:MAG: DUF6949 family protein [Devosia sp.]
MINEGLIAVDGVQTPGDGERLVMFKELLPLYLIAVGLCLAGAGTHLYQWLAKQQALLRFDGRNFAAAMGHLVMSFVCGPYIMLQLGWRQEEGGAISMTSALVSAVVAFGWAFITGLIFMGLYVLLPF